MLFGLSSSTRSLLEKIVDLDREDGLVFGPERNLDFYEIFSGAGHLSDEMEAVSG